MLFVVLIVFCMICCEDRFLIEICLFLLVLFIVWLVMWILIELWCDIRVILFFCLMRCCIIRLLFDSRVLVCNGWWVMWLIVVLGLVSIVLVIWVVLCWVVVILVVVRVFLVLILWLSISMVWLWCIFIGMNRC